MRSRFLFGALTLAMALSPQAQGKKTLSATGLSVRQQVDSEIGNLKKNILKSKTNDERWKFLDKTLNNVKSLRNQSPRQFEGDEIYMDLLVGSLEEIPTKDKFRLDQCAKYETRIVVNYNPHQDTEPNEAITRSLEVLKDLCAGKK